MKKRIYLLFICWMMTFSAIAQQIQQSEALKIGIAFYGTNTKLTLAYKGGSAGTPDYYAFNVEKGTGFIIVAGDHRMPDLIPVYSLTGSFNIDLLPEAFRDLLHNYSQEVSRVRNLPASKIQAKTNIQNNSVKPLADIAQTGPLLNNITWNQYSPYNDQCPIINGQRAVTGCVATGTSQVMKFHSWPLKGNGKVGNIDYSKATYNWDLMLPFYDNNSSAEQKAEVAKLMFHVGNAVNMKYGTDGSGTSTREIPKALTNYFNYSPKIQSIYRTTYTDQEWYEMLKREIDLKRPVLYAGSGSMGSHLFICDGYDSEGRLHYNYGWGGISDGFVALSACLFPTVNEAVIGIYPNNAAVSDADQAAPQVVIVSAINSSSYEPKLGTKFNISTQVANYSYTEFNSDLALALYQGEKMIGSPIQQITQKLVGIVPVGVPTTATGAQNITFKDVLIPTSTPDGNYTLRLVSKVGTAWFPALRVVSDVTQEIDVTIKSGTATLTYPFEEQGSRLELVSPIEVNVAGNRARLRCSIRNTDDFYNCENTDVSVLIAPNNELMPTIWKRVHISSLPSGFVQQIEITDIPLPAGTSVNTCRFYIAYNHVANLPGKDRDIASVPMLPSKYNFKTYTIPSERLISNMDFKTTEIPETYKKYNPEGVEDNEAWGKGILSKASSKSKGSKLVTAAIHVTDENDVLEWSTSNMYSSEVPFTLYISAEGQDASNFTTPVYNTVFPAAGVARLNLSEYAGKDIYIAFEAPINGQFGLIYFKLLNIKTPKDISVQGVNVTGSVQSGQQIPVKVNIKNHSAANVREVNASYTIGDKTVNEVIQTDIAFNETHEFTFTEPIIATGNAGDIVPVKVHVEQIGEEAPQMGNNNGEAQYTVMNFFPKKGALLFKTTKVGCWGCMLTYAALDRAEEEYPENTAAVELWRNGIFSTPDFPNYTTYGTTPSFYVNGAYKFSIENTLESLRNIALTENPPADIFARANYENENSRKLKISIRSNFALPVNGDYKLGAIIIENNVINTEGQISGTHPTGEKLVKNHIPVGVVGKYDGSEGFHIENPQAKEYIYNCEFTIPEETATRFRKDNIQVIGVLYGPNGQILNSSLNNHYLKLPQTQGLTFKATEGYPDFKLIYELKEVASNFESITNYRAAIATGNNYQFRIEKDASWEGKRPKLTVNKNAHYNVDKEEVLEPDANGVYTIENAQKHYYISIEAVEDIKPDPIQPFEVKHEGKVLKNGDVITVESYELVNSNLMMKFETEVTNTSASAYSMRMQKKEVSLMPNTSNYLCWDQCMDPSNEYAYSANIAPDQMQIASADMVLNFNGDEPIKGTSVLQYTFMTDNKSDLSLMVEVHYAYDGTFTGINETTHTNGFSIRVNDGVLEIHTEKQMNASLYGIDGRRLRELQLVPGVNYVTELMKGVYLINGQKVIILKQN